MQRAITCPACGKEVFCPADVRGGPVTCPYCDANLASAGARRAEARWRLNRMQGTLGRLVRALDRWAVLGAIAICALMLCTAMFQEMARPRPPSIPSWTLDTVCFLTMPVTALGIGLRWARNPVLVRVGLGLLGLVALTGLLAVAGLLTFCVVCSAGIV